ncbi:hypothetical protein D3C81_972740 [compost metagenome]
MLIGDAFWLQANPYVKRLSHRCNRVRGLRGIVGFACIEQYGQVGAGSDLEMHIPINCVGASGLQRIKATRITADQPLHVRAIGNDFEVNAIRRAIDLACRADLVLAVDALVFSEGVEEVPVDVRQVKVDGEERRLGVGSFADFGLMLDDNTSVIGPLPAIHKRMVLVVGFGLRSAQIDNGAVGNGPDRKRSGGTGWLCRQVDAAVPAERVAERKATGARLASLHRAVHPLAISECAVHYVVGVGDITGACCSARQEGGTDQHDCCQSETGKSPLGCASAAGMLGSPGSNSLGPGRPWVLACAIHVPGVPCSMPSALMRM